MCIKLIKSWIEELETLYSSTHPKPSYVHQKSQNAHLVDMNDLFLENKESIIPVGVTSKRV